MTLLIYIHRKSQPVMVLDTGEFKESEHPREKGGEEAGQFTSGGSGSTSTEGKKTSNTPTSKSVSEMEWKEFNETHKGDESKLANFLGEEYGSLAFESAYNTLNYKPEYEKSIGVVGAAALSSYCSDTSQELNNSLRSGKPSEEAELYSKELNKALSKLPSHEGEVYRGVMLTSDQVSKYKVGEVFNERAFTSTSQNKSLAQSFGSNPKNSRTQGGSTVMFHIKSKTGVDVSDFEAESEKEVLFKSGTKFRVVSNNGSEIKLEEL